MKIGLGGGGGVGKRLLVLDYSGGDLIRPSE